MALFLGSSKKVKANIEGVTYRLNWISDPLITNGIRLVSSDGYLFKDARSVYLTAKEDD